MASRSTQTPFGPYEISYLLEGPTDGPKVLILHGWGAHKELMKNSFSRHLSGVRALYLDLPGFGASPNDRVLETADYAAIVSAFLKELEFEPQAIVGHSFGGKIATLLNPPLLVLLSSAGIPKQKSLIVRAKIALAKLFKFAAGNTLRNKLRTQDAAGLPEHMYETLKRVVDEDFSVHFAARKGKTLIFWGQADKSTPLYTGEKIHSLINGSRFTPLAGDHFFFAAHGALIAKEIEKSLRN